MQKVGEHGAAAEVAEPFMVQPSHSGANVGIDLHCCVFLHRMCMCKDVTVGKDTCKQLEIGIVLILPLGLDAMTKEDATI